MQPLVVPGSQIANGSLTTDDVVYVATGNNTVYAIDASTGAILLSVNLGSRGSDTTQYTATMGRMLEFTGTPVIDLNSQTLFVIAYVNTSPTPTFYLHALDLSTLADKINLNPPTTGVPVTASHYEANGSIICSTPRFKQRPALLLQNGNVYAGFGSFCDFSADLSRAGFLDGTPPLSSRFRDSSRTARRTSSMTRKQPTLASTLRFSSAGSGCLAMALRATELIFTSRPETPTATDVSSPPCPSSSTWDGTTHIQEERGAALESFVPAASSRRRILSRLDQGDPDLGSGGVLLFPTATYPYLAAAAGKDGRLFLLDPPIWAQPTNTPPPPPARRRRWLHNKAILAGAGRHFLLARTGSAGVVTSQGNTLRTWQVQLPLAPEAAATIPPPAKIQGFFTSISSQSSDGTRYGKAKPGSAIIWAVRRPTGAGNNPTAVTLYAFDARPSGSPTTFKQLFSAAAGSWPNTGGNANIVPVVFDGKVYVASAYLDASGNTRGQLNIFGIAGTGTPLASAVAAPASPYLVSGTLTAVSGSTLTLRTRTGRVKTIDVSQAKQNRRVGAFPLKVGAALTVLGSMIEGNGALLATAVVRAKGSSGDLWPPDH